MLEGLFVYVLVCFGEGRPYSFPPDGPYSGTFVG